MAQNIKEGQSFHVSGDSKDFWIEDYDVRVVTAGVILSTPSPKDKKVLVTLDYIGGDSNVTVRIKRSALKAKGDTLKT